MLTTRADVRRGVDDHGAEAFADQRRGAGAVGGSSLPGVRVELNPTALNKYGIGLEDVRTVLAAANAKRPKGHFSDGRRACGRSARTIRFSRPSEYQPLIVAYHNGARGARFPTSAR